MRALWREPLLHFLLLGLALFVLYDVVADGPASSSDSIRVTRGDVAQLQAGWQRQWGRPPTDAELEGLIADHVQEQMLYREALALGLDRDDTIVRRRLVQKVEFLVTDLAAVEAPDDEALEVYLAAHAERFRVPATFTFQQLYFGRGAHGEAPEKAALAAAAAIGQDAPLAIEDVGDRILLPRRHAGVTEARTAQVFGVDFARALVALETGGWRGPVPSGYGAHLVWVEERTPARDPELAEIREDVARQWLSDRREQEKLAFHQRLRQRYAVEIEPYE